MRRRHRRESGSLLRTAPLPESVGETFSLEGQSDQFASVLAKSRQEFECGCNFDRRSIGNAQV